MHHSCSIASSVSGVWQWMHAYSVNMPGGKSCDRDVCMARNCIKMQRGLNAKNFAIHAWPDHSHPEQLDESYICFSIFWLIHLGHHKLYRNCPTTEGAHKHSQSGWLFVSLSLFFSIPFLRCACTIALGILEAEFYESDVEIIPITYPFATSHIWWPINQADELNIKFDFRSSRTTAVLAYGEVTTAEGNGFWEVSVRDAWIVTGPSWAWGVETKLSTNRRARGRGCAERGDDSSGNERAAIYERCQRSGGGKWRRSRIECVICMCVRRIRWSYARTFSYNKVREWICGIWTTDAASVAFIGLVSRWLFWCSEPVGEQLARTHCRIYSWLVMSANVRMCECMRAASVKAIYI